MDAMQSLSLPPSVLNPIIQTFVNMNASRYTCAAGVVVMLYDWLLTLSSEVDLVWKRRKGFISILYLVNRYFPVPFLLLFNYHIAGLRPSVSDNFCKGEVLTMVITMGVTLTIATWLLSLRVVSLWSMNRVVVYSVYVIYVTMQVVTWTLTIISIHNMYPTISYFDGVKLCGASSVDIIGGAYFAPISFEIYIFSLQVIHHFRHARVNRKHSIPTLPLLKTLYHDGYVYFIVVVSLRLMTCLVWALAPGSLWYMSNQLEFAMTVALTSRFHLNLRSAAIQDERSSVNTNTCVVVSDSPTHPRSIAQPPYARLNRVKPTAFSLQSNPGGITEVNVGDMESYWKDTLDGRDEEVSRVLNTSYEMEDVQMGKWDRGFDAEKPRDIPGTHINPDSPQSNDVRWIWPHQASRP